MFRQTSRNTNTSSSSDYSFGKLCSDISDATFPVIGGCVVFGTTLAVSTAAQKLIGVSTGTTIVPTCLGIATVCGASLVSEQAAISIYERLKRTDPKKGSFEYVQRKIKNRVLETSSTIIESSTQLRARKKYQFKLPMHEVRVCVSI